MARPPISVTNLSDTLHMAECHDGFWLYDDTRGMNLSMQAKTREAALLEALMYYQARFLTMESEYRKLQSQVNAFVEQFAEENNNDGWG